MKKTKLGKRICASLLSVLLITMSSGCGKKDEYQDNKVKVIGDNKLNDMDNRLFAYNVLNAKKTTDTLEITFRLAYLDYQYSNTNTKVLMYNSLNDTNEIKTITLNQTIENGTTKDEIFDVKNIEDQFNTYKYTLKLVNGNTYFVSLEQI